MPFAIDEEKFKDRLSLDMSQPHNPATGIPVKQIPILEYPRLVYKHPSEPFKTVLHRNAKHEIVHEEIVPTEHIYKRIENQKELAIALKEGWVEKPYIAPPLPDADAHLYK